MAESIQALIETGLKHHGAGRFTEAEACYRQALAQDPACAPALHLLGVAQSQQGHKAPGAELIKRAIAISPNVPEFHANLALLYVEHGRADLAVAAARQALALNPNYPDAYNHLGNAFRMLGKTNESIAALQQALRLRGDFLDALHNLSLVLTDAGRVEEAAHCLQHAAAIRGGGSAGGADGDPRTQLYLGGVLHRQKRYAEAVSAYQKALAANFEPASVYSNLGAAYQEMGRAEEALECYRKSIELEPTRPGAYKNFGNALCKLGRLDDAIEQYKIALKHRPDASEIYNDLANTHRDKQEIAEALAAYDKAIYFKPEYVEAHWNRAILLLLMGDFERGWQEYQWRWVHFPDDRRGFPQPQWDGGFDIAGKSILLHAEQGLGDTLQFCRFAPRVAELGATVYVECQRALEPLLRQLPGVSRVIARGEALPEFDFHCPLLSVPYGLGMRDINWLPRESGYLTPDAGLVRLWAGKMGSEQKKKIGIAWAGSSTHGKDHERSLALSQITPLLQTPGTQFFSLQKDLPARDREAMGSAAITDLTADLRDFADSAALIANCDLVITVDTAAAHLAGALGKPVWILVPFNPDWRWLMKRQDTPWYPTARLFRQSAPQEWGDTIQRIARELSL